MRAAPQHPHLFRIPPTASSPSYPTLTYPPLSLLRNTMPHNIYNSVFMRTALTTCDVFIHALGFLDARHALTPEQLLESASPWFLDPDVVWSRKFMMAWR
ncbi:hypothetical protein BS50DRAFT_629970 [Corynespora cassiicola Philippines]|uniref:Uncharacterized protein n=1 Tax=Corynespora cassiicola Philippines TaxID=1448308 RepID=A0A2T2P2D7_CORCC|nr:hypothetical protein BS50DRAFT_629970 [Corynespora cassiicola Philippines]